MLLEKVKTYITEDDDLQIITKAYEYANDKHFGQKRLTGEDYVSHLLNVAYILTNVNADAKTIAASLLHDVIECGVTMEEVSSEFGEEIASIIIGVNKINKLNLSNDSKTNILNQRKILVGLSEDVRVIIIKLADRLHNMKTLYVLDEEQQKQTARETLDILTPIAHRLGMNNIKTELEELSLRYLKPDEYYDIVEKLNATKAQRDASVYKMLESVSQLLNKHEIKHDIKGRAKSIYSIYKKLDKGRRWSDIYDLLALRVFVETEEQCYQALGIIHSKFKPIGSRFKDYIAMPKTNMYQSLHTTVFGFDGQLYEIQIRTYDMDKTAENGIAAHWSYKEGSKSSMQNAMEQKLQFFKSLMELQKNEEDPEDFVKSVKEDILKNTIYVYTPLGDVVELPAESTPIDFAYKVHSKVGDTMTGAIVNSNMVPIDYKLQNQDIVKINTNSSAKPSIEWLNIVKTSQAKNKIKSYFNKINKDENIAKGEEIFKNILRKNKISQSDFDIDELLSKLKVSSINEVYVQLGTGKINEDNIISYKKQPSVEEKLLDKTIKFSKIVPSDNVIAVNGMNDIKVNLAGCCHPVYGDRIVGYITKGNGITIHRMVCPNIANERLIETSWNKTNAKFETELLVTSSLNDNLLVDVISKINNNEAGIKNIINNKKIDIQIIELTVVVKGKEELNKIINDIQMISSVKEVKRMIK